MKEKAKSSISNAMSLNHFTTGKKYGNWILAVLIFVFTFSIFAPTIKKGWWTVDDPVLLLQAIKYCPWKFFFVPQVWQRISSIHLTPWHILSLYLDFTLFNLNPHMFYVHQVFICGLIGTLTFLLLKKWCDRWTALTASLLIILIPPLFASAQYLWIRHYLEGLLFSIASFLCFANYSENKSKKWLIASVLLYLMSVTCKELYVPVALLYIIYPHKNASIKDRFVFLLLLLLYPVWRLYMLGFNNIVYSKTDHALLPILNLPKSILKALFSNEIYIIFYAVLFTLLLALFFIKNRFDLKLLLCAVTLIIAVFGPIIPVSPDILFATSNTHTLIQHNSVLRYVSFASYCFVVSFTLILNATLKDKKAVLPLLLPLAFSFTHLDIQIYKSTTSEIFTPYRVISKFLIYGGSDKVFIHSYGDVTYPFTSIIQLYRFLKLTDERKTAYYCIDSCMCFSKIPQNLTLYAYEKGKIAKTKAKCRLKKSKIVIKKLRYSRGTASWHFEPYTSGKYCFVNLSFNESDYPTEKIYPYGLMCVPFRGAIRVPTQIRHESIVALKYCSPEGWSMYYPYLISVSPQGIRILKEKIKGIAFHDESR